MDLWSPESAVIRYARESGCLRPSPFTALCVGCEYRSACPVPRIPLILWTSRITLDMGRADTIFYFNEIALAAPMPDKVTLPQSGITTARSNVIEVRCGDILVDPASQGSGIDASLTIHLPTYLNPDGEKCERPVLVEARHLRCMQYSNHGRKGILAVQTCSKDCAVSLTATVNRNWRTVLELLREIRPLRHAERRVTA